MGKGENEPRTTHVVAPRLEFGVVCFPGTKVPGYRMTPLRGSGKDHCLHKQTRPKPGLSHVAVPKLRCKKPN